jgi:hypothetical protein
MHVVGPFKHNKDNVTNGRPGTAVGIATGEAYSDVGVVVPKRMESAPSTGVHGRAGSNWKPTRFGAGVSEPAGID